MSRDPRELVLDAFMAGVRAVDAGRAVRAALEELQPTRPLHILSAGKAGVPMMAETLEHLERANIEPTEALLVAPPGAIGSLGRARVVQGDHPHPGPASLRAAEHIASFAADVKGGEVWILLSGGFSSLAGAPVEGVSPAALTALFDVLLGSGIDVHAMNGIRKRFLRWGAGRLAVALSSARIRVLAVSDVPGDREEDIGSGPCSPDQLTISDVSLQLRQLPLRGRIPAEMVHALELGPRETPKPGHPAFAGVTFSIVARNADAVSAAAERAISLVPGSTERVILAGDASIAGASIGARLAAMPPGRWIIGGGETAVTLGPLREPGGRCQELALAAARELRGIDGVALLVAGTDGVDGTTDAAGAIVDGTTWDAIHGAGVDPAAALAEHRTHAALGAATALVRTGPTGTNVMDLVVGLRGSGM